MADHPWYTIASEKDLEKSRKEFEIEVPADAFGKERLSVLRHFVAEAQLPGFRKGKAPEALVEKRVGESRVTEEAANNLINRVAFSVLSERQIAFVGQPSVSVTMLAPGNPLRFAVTVSLVPEVTLPDYKKIAAAENAKKQPESEVSDKELEESLAYLTKALARQSGTDHKAPELTDQFVQQLGNFKTVAEFKEKLRQDLLIDKKNRLREKKLLEIIEALVAKTRVDIPDALVENELDRIQSEFMHDIERMGQKPDEYLKRIKKTEEELRKEWRKNAEKRALFELIVPKIARAENLSVPPGDVEREAAHLLEHHKGADKEAAKLYVEKALLRQKVLEFLERQK